MRDRALAKALAEVALNNLPRLVRQDGREQTWSVHSRTNHACPHCGAIADGAPEIYLVTSSPAGDLFCDCPARLACWHIQIVALAREGRIGHFDARFDRRTV